MRALPTVTIVFEPVDNLFRSVADTNQIPGMYAAAARVTRYDRQTLMNMVYVAARFAISRPEESVLVRDLREERA